MAVEAAAGAAAAPAAPPPPPPAPPTSDPAADPVATLRRLQRETFAELVGLRARLERLEGGAGKGGGARGSGGGAKGNGSGGAPSPRLRLTKQMPGPTTLEVLMEHQDKGSTLAAAVAVADGGRDPPRLRRAVYRTPLGRGVAGKLLCCGGDGSDAAPRLWALASLGGTDAAAQEGTPLHARCKGSGFAVVAEPFGGAVGLGAASLGPVSGSPMQSQLLQLTARPAGGRFAAAATVVESGRTVGPAPERPHRWDAGAQAIASLGTLGTVSAWACAPNARLRGDRAASSPEWGLGFASADPNNTWGVVVGQRHPAGGEPRPSEPPPLKCDILLRYLHSDTCAVTPSMSLSNLSSPTGPTAQFFMQYQWYLL